MFSAVGSTHWRRFRRNRIFDYREVATQSFSTKITCRVLFITIMIFFPLVFLAAVIKRVAYDQIII